VNWTDPRIVFVLPMLVVLMAWMALGILLRPRRRLRAIQ
jgi:hypothetical protein